MGDGTGLIRRFYEDVIGNGQLDLVEPTIADGDLEAAHVVLTGTHNGELMGVAATGKTVEFGSIDIIRVEHGKVAEHWGVTDAMTLMQQVGALPE
ncbi:MAG TPA: ester cyclase [Propionibacteriaceae bacterium]|jgi:predicted ester cyclase|nr:ester cyclase [Propionibacteriaceae bacterium]